MVPEVMVSDVHAQVAVPAFALQISPLSDDDLVRDDVGMDLRASDEPDNPGDVGDVFVIEVLVEAVPAAEGPLPAQFICVEGWPPRKA